MAQHGTLAPFDLSKESWSHYVERLGYYFVANDVEGDDKETLHAALHLWASDLQINKFT